MLFHTARPPQVTIDGGEVQISLGSTLVLRPNIDFGSPNATITWSVNGRVLEENAPNVEISSEGVLTVTNIQSGGNYTTTASNTSSDTVIVILPAVRPESKDYFQEIPGLYPP